MSELQPLLDLLQSKFSWLPAFCKWVVIFRFTFKFCSARLQQWAARKLASIAKSPDDSDDRMLVTILEHRTYRIFAFGLDLVCSIKLPSAADYRLEFNKRSATQ